jgi:uncharacterized delta-60 repeat protein
MYAILRVGLAAIALAAFSASPTFADPAVEAAPGRIIFPVANGRARLSSAIALPTGGALLVGQIEGSGRVYVAKVSESGTLDSAFGSDGIASIDADLSFEQILLQPDGHMLLVGMHSRRGHFAELSWGEPHGSLVAVGLNPDGSIDRGFGVDGTAQTTLEGGCSCRRIALEQEDGSLVFTGQRRATVHAHGQTRESYGWALARLTATGRLDPSFGIGGVALIAGENGVGLSIAPSENDTIVAQGQTQVTDKDGSYGPENMMTRVSADGALDSTYGGGTPFELPVFSIDDSYGQTPEPLESVSEPDGRVVIETAPIPANPGQPKAGFGVGLIGYDAAGRIDSSFGYEGHLDLEEGREPSGSALLAAPDGEIIAVHRRGSTQPSENPQSVPGIVEFERVTDVGRLDETFAEPPGFAVEIPFGGGLGEPGPLSPSTYPETRIALDQNTFLGQRSSAITLPMPDGSYLLAGNVSLTVPAGPRAPEVTTTRFALAALTPSLALEPAFGRPARTANVSLRVPAQTLSDDLSHRRVLVEVAGSAVGLAEIRLFSHGHPLAHKLVALLSTGRIRVPVPLSGSPRRYLLAHRPSQLRATVTLRDLFADNAQGSTTVTLRSPPRTAGGRSGPAPTG